MAYCFTNTPGVSYLILLRGIDLDGLDKQGLSIYLELRSVNLAFGDLLLSQVVSPHPQYRCTSFSVGSDVVLDGVHLIQVISSCFGLHARRNQSAKDGDDGAPIAASWFLEFALGVLKHCPWALSCFTTVLPSGPVVTLGMMFK